MKLEVVIELGEMDVAGLASAVKMAVQEIEIPHPGGGLMYMEELSVLVKDVSA